MRWRWHCGRVGAAVVAGALARMIEPQLVVNLVRGNIRRRQATPACLWGAPREQLLSHLCRPESHALLESTVRARGAQLDAPSHQIRNVVMNSRVTEITGL